MPPFALLLLSELQEGAAEIGQTQHTVPGTFDVPSLAVTSGPSFTLMCLQTRLSRSSTSLSYYYGSNNLALEEDGSAKKTAEDLPQEVRELLRITNTPTPTGIPT